LNSQQTLINDLIARIEALELCDCKIKDKPGRLLRVESLDTGAKLFQNTPNPLDENTVIKYFVPTEYNYANIVFSNNIGQVIMDVKLNDLGQGELLFNKDALASGIYFYTLYAGGNKIDTKKMVIE